MSQSTKMLLAVVAAIAASALAASAAWATEVAQWLVAGKAIEPGTKVEAEVEKEPVSLILVEDMAATGKPDILCEIEKSHGELEYNGEAEVTAMECLKPVVDSGTCASPKVSAANLPWRVEITEPSEGVFDTTTSSEKGTGAGWTVECTVLGIKVLDTCTSNDAKSVLTNTEAGLVSAALIEEESKEEEGTCTVGGKEEGLQGGSILFQALNATKEAESLSVGRAPVTFEGPSWWVKGARMGAGVEKNIATTATEPFTLETSGLVIVCKKLNYNGQIAGSAAEKTGTGKGEITFTECEDKTEKGCEVFSILKKGAEMSPSGQIGAIPIETELGFVKDTRFEAIQFFLGLETNAKNEPVFTLLLFKKKTGETCAAESTEATTVTGLGFLGLLANPANGSPLGSQAQLAEVLFAFPKPFIRNIEEWSSRNGRYDFRGIELKVGANQFVISGGLTTKLSTAEEFGWTKS
jgi:hypothetical protein